MLITNFEKFSNFADFDNFANIAKKIVEYKNPWNVFVMIFDKYSKAWNVHIMLDSSQLYRINLEHAYDITVHKIQGICLFHYTTENVSHKK